MHPWSLDAAIAARYFDKSQLGQRFRGYIFRNQTQMTRATCASTSTNSPMRTRPLPFVFDPDGQLKAKVMADRDLGNKIG
jgi:hypothetical protein